jgi:hypothetical protein
MDKVHCYSNEVQIEITVYVNGLWMKRSIHAGNNTMASIVRLLGSIWRS